MSASDPLTAAYIAAGRLVRETPVLMDFAGWPAARPETVAALAVPATDHLADWPLAPGAAHTDLISALKSAARDAEWRQTYSEAEVGRDFLARYGYFELVGPSGHFRSDEIRAFVAIWGGDLFYDWHHHEAEELYFILDGSAEFRAEGKAPETLGSGDACLHLANQPHAMTSGANGVLTLVLWRGAGLDGSAQMGRG